MRKKPCGVASKRVFNLVPAASGVSVAVKSTLTGPPFTKRQRRGRSYSRHSRVTTLLLDHLARNRVPTSTGPSVSFSMTLDLGVPLELVARVGEVVEDLFRGALDEHRALDDRHPSMVAPGLGAVDLPLFQARSA